NHGSRPATGPLSPCRTEPVSAKRVRHDMMPVDMIGTPPVLAPAGVLIHLKRPLRSIEGRSAFWGAPHGRRARPRRQGYGERPVPQVDGAAIAQVPEAAWVLCLPRVA